MIEWYSWVLGGVAALAGLAALVFAALRRGPNDYTLGLTALLGVLLFGQIVISIAAPFLGNEASGDPLEYWMYLITAFFMIPAAMIWALVERKVSSQIVLAVVGLSIAVMVARMHQIWFINGA